MLLVVGQLEVRHSFTVPSLYRHIPSALMIPSSFK
jgi:hypothetical protein